jgi:hypothetical protein
MKNNIFLRTLILIILCWSSGIISASEESTIKKFQNQASQLKGQELFDWLMHFSSEHPRNPIIHGQNALLLFDPSTTALSVQGDFNSWARYQPTEISKDQSQIHAQPLGKTE